MTTKFTKGGILSATQLNKLSASSSSGGESECDLVVTVDVTYTSYTDFKATVDATSAEIVSALNEGKLVGGKLIEHFYNGNISTRKLDYVGTVMANPSYGNLAKLCATAIVPAKIQNVDTWTLNTYYVVWNGKNAWDATKVSLDLTANA